MVRSRWSQRSSKSLQRRSNTWASDRAARISSWPMMVNPTTVAPDIVVGAPQYVLAIAITILILLVLRGVVLLESRSRLRGPTQPSPGDDPRQGAPPPSDAR